MTNQDTPPAINVKIPMWAKVIVVLLTLFFIPPIGLAVLVFFVWSNRDAIKRLIIEAKATGNGDVTHNTAFAERQREAHGAMNKEAEAFAERQREASRVLADERAKFEEFTRKQREEQDRKDLEAFIAEQTNSKRGD
jgi:hypothetical protein